MNYDKVLSPCNAVYPVFSPLLFRIFSSLNLWNELHKFFPHLSPHRTEIVQGSICSSHWIRKQRQLKRPSPHYAEWDCCWVGDIAFLNEPYYCCCCFCYSLPVENWHIKGKDSTLLQCPLWSCVGYLLRTLLGGGGGKHSKTSPPSFSMKWYSPEFYHHKLPPHLLYIFV